jgi:hypothetical protein
MAGYRRDEAVNNPAWDRHDFTGNPFLDDEPEVMRPVGATITLEPASDSDDWCWSVEVDGEVYADGHCATKAEAERKAFANYSEWFNKN